jgi:hypothetical protein
VKAGAGGNIWENWAPIVSVVVVVVDRVLPNYRCCDCEMTQIRCDNNVKQRSFSELYLYLS